MSDAGSPYSSEQWQSNFGNSETPLVIDENASSIGMFSLFHDSWNAFPTFALLDHTMTVRAKPWTLDNNSNSNSCDGTNTTINGWSGGSTSDFIQQLVDECGTLCEGCSGPDSDGDGTPDECDSCANLSGDVNDDTVIDVLDIVTVVNMILSGGNSSDYTDCEMQDADMTGDGNINILDVIQIINVVLGDLNKQDCSDVSGYVDTKYDIKGDDLYLTFTSKSSFTGLELDFLTDSKLEIVKTDNPGFAMDYNKHDGVEHCVVYSLNNDSFKNNTLNLVIKDGALLDIEAMNIVAGNAAGCEISDRWLMAEVHNFNISNIYPNPFNPVTQIDYDVNLAGQVRLSIYNVLGQEVAVLHDGFSSEGSYSINWDANALSSGVYYVRMLMNGQMETKKAILLK